MDEWVRRMRTLAPLARGGSAARAPGIQTDELRRASELSSAVETDGQCSPRQQSHFEPSFLELNGIL